MFAIRLRKAPKVCCGKLAVWENENLWAVLRRTAFSVLLIVVRHAGIPPPEGQAQGAIKAPEY